jgi:general secretion pathway protein D
MEDRKTLTVNKVPILGDLPLVGPVFSRTEAAKTKTELLIFLTPHVAAAPEALRPMSEEELGGTKLTPNAIQPGMFNEHLKGMERGRRATTMPATRPAAAE